MLKRWFIVSFISIYWQYVACRNLPHPDNSYLYLNPHPYQLAFPQQYQQLYNSPFYSPPGTYLDQRKGILRPFPCGGVPVLVDYNKRCPDQYVGIMAHQEEEQYYYVCKPDSMILGKCQNLQIFNATSKQCVQHPPPEYIPTCTEEGRFPLFSDCHLYYKCEKDLKPKIYSCPNSMVFSPASKKCTNINKCTHTLISSYSSYMPDYCANKFPPCFENGTFRSPSDCSLYYKCDSKNNNIFIQTRLRCPPGTFYDLHKNDCLPAKEVPCDCIQLTEVVHPMPNNLPMHLAAYPSQFDLDAVGAYQYPAEPTGELKENFSTSESTKDVMNDETTVLNDKLSEKNLQNELLMDTAILSDFIDLDHTEEGSGFESDANEMPRTTVTTESLQEETMTTSDNVKIEMESTIVNNQETTEVGQFAITNNVSGETTNAPDKITEELEKATTEILLTSTEMGTKTIITQEEEEEEEEVTTHKVSAHLRLSPDTDTTISSTVLNAFKLNTDSEKTIATTVLGHTDSLSSTIRDQTSTVIPTTTTHLNTTYSTLTSNNFETTQHPNENTSALGSVNSLSNFLDADTNLVTTEMSQSSDITTREEATQQTDIASSQDIDNLPRKNLDFTTIIDNLPRINLDFTTISTTLTAKDEATEEIISKAANFKRAMQLDGEPEAPLNPLEKFELQQFTPTENDRLDATDNILQLKKDFQMDNVKIVNKTIEKFGENLMSNNESVNQTNDLEKKYNDDDFTTISIKKETTQIYSQTKQMEEGEPKDRSTTILNTTEQPDRTTLSITTSKQEEIMLDDDPSKYEIGKEVSNHESTSAETNQTTTNSKQSFPHPTSITLTSTQTPILSSIFTIRLPPNHSLLNYIIKIEPVTNHNNKSNNDTVTASPRDQTNNRHIPRLEVKLQSPMEIFFSVCPLTCNKTHEHSYSMADNRHAVLVRWFPNESNQTLALETQN